MFGAFKRIFKKEPETLPSAQVQAPEKPSPKPAAPAPAAKPAAAPAQPAMAPAVQPVTAEKQVATASTADKLSLPIRPIASRLPNALATLISAGASGNCSLPIKTIMTQLPKGIVKIPFGQLRSGSPPGTFIDNAIHDQTLVEIPLHEILTRLDPALLALRPDQKQVSVPDEVRGVFGSTGKIVAPPPGTQFFEKSKVTPTVSTEELKAPIAFPSAPRIDTQKPAAPAVISPRPPAPATPSMAQPKAPSFGTSFITKSAAGCLTLELAAISEHWPDGIRNEIGLQNATVDLPLNRVEQGLKVARVAFTWNEIRKWIKPPALSMTSRGETVVEIPLKVLVPIFLAQYRSSTTQKTIVIGDNIPDVFSSTGSMTAAPPASTVEQTESAASTVAPSEPIPFKLPSAPVQSPTPAKPASPAPSQAVIDKLASSLPQSAPIAMPRPAAQVSPLGEIFGTPTRNDWTPDEIVKKTAALKGVSGSLIAMSDGLLVAAQLPPMLKGENISAFLPQIFGRMSQYSKEWQLGDLNSLTLMLGKIPCQIFKSGTVYFLVVGRVEESLPSTQLEVIATEIAKRNI